MKRKKLPIIFSLMILVIFLSVFSVTGCKVAEGIDKEEILSTEESEKDPEKEVNGETSDIEEEISGIISISPAEVYEIITNDEDYIILDVRTQDEYNEGHLDKALLIPVDELEGRIDELDQNNPIIVYCRSGARSNRAANILIENGFNEVYDMGGIMGWQEAGFPVVTDDDTEEILEFKTITVDEAYEVFLNNEDYIFIDVRSEDEYKSSHIKNAIHMPVSEIEERLDEIPDDRSLIVYCNGSGCDRSGRAAGILIENGLSNVYDMVGRGIFEWEEKGYPVERE
jgi:rhodanese-related sulfurtransferase